MTRTVNDPLAYARKHVRFGWWSLLAFLTLGFALEVLHGFKAQMYLDVSNETRRLMWTLAHAHGSLISLIHVVFGVCLRTIPELETNNLRLLPGWRDVLQRRSRHRDRASTDRRGATGSCGVPYRGLSGRNEPESEVRAGHRSQAAQLAQAGAIRHRRLTRFPHPCREGAHGAPRRSGAGQCPPRERRRGAWGSSPI